MRATGDDIPVTTIEPATGFETIDIAELRRYRDLFYFLVLRDIKVLYAQTILGFAWAILNPAVQIILFAVVFGAVANIPTDGIPYVLFSTVAIIPWTYMSEAMIQSSQSLVTGQHMLGKVYFPRIIFPLTPVLAKLLDFAISLLLLIGIMVYYGVAPSWNLLWLPVLVVFMMCIPAGFGLWLSALAIRFRDVKFAMPFVMRMLIYTAPILYTASSVPDQYRFWYSLNPIVGVVEGFRAALLGSPMPWEFIVPGAVTGVLMVVAGAIYFRRMERVFVDVI
ncbi:MAG: phosphate ABC transporter permease [Candidatus Muproteobacteria bacterium RBG_16_60_9]|uniref:Transport permease protein n=1 Tax=Candidatus Muproteobacteria bacterium RBG_16_60_9 TaxID=1817755 RepID=A0A1F6UWF8_9PROT|nr:MAG: phosphate ABC transporter permease [Candidatus Muproteobacteria bacterium RBG_16_60_9]